MPNLSRQRLASTVCAIKRIHHSGGYTDLPGDHLAEVPCTPLMPRLTYQKSEAVSAAVVGYETVVFGNHDITTGDVLVIGGKEYPITNVYPYPVADPFLVLALADPQANVEPDSAFLR